METMSITVDEAQRRLDAILARLGWPATTRHRLPASLAGDVESLSAAFFTIGEMDEPIYLQANPQLDVSSAADRRERLCDAISNLFWLAWRVVAGVVGGT
jgi:hypothetical protein